jgi:hypothetical protein
MRVPLLISRLINVSRFAVLLAFSVGAWSGVCAQDTPLVQVLRLDKLELAPGIITPAVARRFQAAPEDVESRIKGSVLATLSQELSSSKLLRLAVREESLARLMNEAKVSDELGSGRNAEAAGPLAVDEANLLALATIEDFVADYRALANAAGAAAKWKLRITISMEVTDRKSGTKKVVKEDFEQTGSGIVSSARIGLPDFDSGQVRALADGIAKKLGTRVLDIFCPPRIIQARGKMFIVDRGRAAGMKEGMIMEVTEPVENNLGTDAGFPVGKARVKTVREETSILELISAEGESDLSKVEIKTTYSLSRPLEDAFGKPEPSVPAGPGSRKGAGSSRQK